MISFKDFMLMERVLSPGLNPSHEKYREQHRNEIHDILRNSYKKVDGGYSGMGSGSDEESKAIHDDISNSLIKMTKRDGKITAVALYKKKFGRKAIAMGTDGSDQGKRDFKKIQLEDHENRRAWGEYSDAPEHMNRKIGVPVVSSKQASKLTGKSDVEIEDEERYKRKIGGEKHSKVIMGYPKDE